MQQFSAHNLGRLDAGKQPRRIHPHHQGSEEPNDAYQSPTRPRRKDIGCKVLSHPTGSNRQCHLEPTQSQNQRQQVQQTGFQQPLYQQLTPGSTEHLAKAELPAPFQVTGDGQIQGIAPSYEQQSDSHHRKKLHRRPTSFFLLFIRLPGRQMDILQRDQLHLPVLVLQSRCPVLRRDAPEALLYFMGLLARLQPDIRVHPMDIPNVAPRFRNRGIGQQKIILQMKVERPVVHDPGHLEMLFGRRRLERQDFSDRIGIGKITASGAGGNDRRMGTDQLLLLFPTDQGERKEVEKGRFRVAVTLFDKLSVLVGHLLLPVLSCHPDRLLDARNLARQDRCMTERGGSPVVRQHMPLIQPAFHPVNPVSFGKGIETPLEPHIKKNQQSRTDTHGKAEYIEYRKRFLDALTANDLSKIFHYRKFNCS
ncbi:hypothetical protein EVA_12063 [gut metagenome]|uniref:Uncharacterized protein n=1 Tax=gut metagenome TaxID=749906 RepID=J9GDH8_9ZZZZ